MADVAVIARAIEYVEGNLREDISVADIAASISYSLYHFCRMFNEATHQTPYDYLIRRRLTEAARSLLQTDARIIDIAYDYRFNSPETFSRAFRRLFDMQPRQWRAQPRVDHRRLVPRLTRAHLEHIAKGTYLKPKLVTLDGFTLVGLMTRYAGDRSDLGEVWELLDNELSGVGAGERLCYYGLAVRPFDAPALPALYVAGIEDHGLDIAGTALIAKPVPAMECARFIHKGAVRELPLTLDYVYHTWLPRSRLHLSIPWVMERFGDNARPDQSLDAEWEILIPVQATAHSMPTGTT